MCVQWRADGVPCVVRCGRGGIIATLSEADIVRAVKSGEPSAVDAFFGKGGGAGFALPVAATDA